MRVAASWAITQASTVTPLASVAELASPAPNLCTSSTSTRRETEWWLDGRRICWVGNSPPPASTGSRLITQRVQFAPRCAFVIATRPPTPQSRRLRTTGFMSTLTNHSERLRLDRPPCSITRTRSSVVAGSLKDRRAAADGRRQDIRVQASFCRLPPAPAPASRISYTFCSVPPYSHRE